jgi:integrative and conjugative element protein (TIGR02256 family)
VAIQRFRQTEPHITEAGGVLLGRHLRDGSAIIVDNITTPLPGDRRSRTRFYRAQRRHQAVIDEAWHTSNGTCTDLGEWHTHPEPIPMPSGVDWTDWKRRLRSDQYSEPIFFVIVGTQQVAAWEGRRDSVLMPLPIIER